MQYQRNFRVNVYYENGSIFPKTCGGNSVVHACHRALKQFNHAVRVESEDGRIHVGQPRPATRLADLGSQFPPSFQKASHDRAVIGEPIGRSPSKLPFTIKVEPPSHYEIFKSIGCKLPPVFTLSDIQDRLAISGYVELSKKKPAVIAMMHKAINQEGVCERVNGKKGVYKFKGTTLTDAPPVKHVEAKKDEVMPKAATEKAKSAEPLLIDARIENLILAMGTALTIGPDDKQVIQAAVAANTAAAEANAKVVAVYERMLSAINMRENFASVFRTGQNEPKK